MSRTNWVIWIIAIIATAVLIATSSSWSERYAWFMCGIWQVIYLINAKTMEIKDKLLQLKESQCPQNRVS